MASLDINTPVYVNRDSGGRLEGVVAFLGTVEFADGDDWVGVRLTGGSAGQGKNDGSVQNKSYFSCPLSCGLFVRRAAVEPRKLSKIEELRLRRELASTGVSVSAPSSSAALPAVTTPTATAAASTNTPAAAARKSRLEELRQRRAQITTERERTGDTNSSPQASPARMGAEAHQTQSQFSPESIVAGATAEQLKAKDESIASLEGKLAASEKDAQHAKSKVSDLEQDIQQLQKKLKVASSAKSTEAAIREPGTLDDIDEERLQLQRENQNLQEQLRQTQEKVLALTKQMEKQKAEHGTEVTQLRSESLAYQNELQALSEQTKQRGVSDASHYKEKAKLQAQIAGLQREVQDLRNEKQDMESTLEDLSLDKDQLQEEKDALQERLEEMKIDSETAQMEVEELRAELEEAKASAERAGSTMELNAAAATVGGSSTESDDMAQALSIQNARLREALIRLREQTSLEKMEWTRQLKTAEKECENAKAQLEKNEALEKAKSKLEEEVGELKDMVEQGAAFEGMVEDLSDRLMLMEEQNVELASTIRELEEAAELTSEMEEVLGQELKAAQRDVEDRDTMIRNLEEAIKMQRKREDDFSRTVGNYRKTVETLKKEKEALLELQEGGEGEKSTLLASSQKALARAAQLVSDAAEMRKREAQAVLVKIDGQVHKHLAERLERMLPSSVAGREISAVKGELLVSKVTGMAAASLEGIAASFQNNIRAVPVEDGAYILEEEGSGETVLSLSDEIKQEVANMLHQSECAKELVDTSCFLLGLLAAGQWPDLVSEDVSLDLGLLVGHSVIDLEATLRAMLKGLKEEGVINSHQTNVDILRQITKSTKQSIHSELQSHLESGKAFPLDWNPPAMDLFDCVSKVKFVCLGVAAAVASVCRSTDMPGALATTLSALLKKVLALSTESVQLCARLVSLDVRKTDDVSKLLTTAHPLKEASESLLEHAREALLQGAVSRENVSACETLVDSAFATMSQFSSVLRSVKLNADESGAFHALSPEADDTWFGLTRLAGTVRSTDGDGDDVNFLIRARSIEHRLSDAVNNEPKLSLANAKVASLEKSLATRSKEIAMQNARLSELEKVLAKTSAKPSPSKMSAAVRSSEELNSLKEENRMLMEAMDVLQEQVAGYENEIRFLKDMKSPKTAGTNKDRRKSAASTAAVLDSLKNVGKPSQRNLMDEMQNVASSASIGALEATLFRPALHHARRDAAKWKSKALTSALLELPPLAVPGLAEGESKEQDIGDGFEMLSRLSSAMASYRMEQASVAVVDLQKCGGKSRAQLRAYRAKEMAASARLESEAEKVKRYLMQQEAGPSTAPTKQLVGKLKLLGEQPSRLVAAHVTTEDLYRLNLHMLR